MMVLAHARSQKCSRLERILLPAVEFFFTRLSYPLAFYGSLGQARDDLFIECDIKGDHRNSHHR